MTIPDFTFRPGDSTPAQMHEVNLLAWILQAEALLVVLPNYTLAHIDDDGRLTTSDYLEGMVRAHGARSMLDADLDLAPPAPWSVRVDQSAGQIGVVGPATLGTLYEGGLDASADWYRLVARQHLQGRGIVVVTGSCAPTMEAAMDMIASGRASWVRGSLDLIGVPR